MITSTDLITDSFKLQEITQMKAKVFNEEKLIREKMKTMARLHDTKVLFF